MNVFIAEIAPAFATGIPPTAVGGWFKSYLQQRTYNISAPTATQQARKPQFALAQRSFTSSFEKYVNNPPTGVGGILNGRNSWFQKSL
jgi:hypothetical protein